MDDILSQGEIDALMADLSDETNDAYEKPIEEADDRELSELSDKELLAQAHVMMEILDKLEKTKFTRQGGDIKFVGVSFDTSVAAEAFINEMNSTIHNKMLAWKRAYRERTAGMLRKMYIKKPEKEVKPTKKLDKVGDE